MSNLKYAVNVNTLFFISLVGAVILTPTLIGPLRLEDLLIFLSLMLMITRKNSKVSFNSLIYISSIIIIVIISVCIGLLFSPETSTFRDLFSIVKFTKFYLLFVIIRYSTMGDNITVMHLLKLFIVFGFISSIVGLLQYFDLFYVNKWLTPLFDDDPFRLKLLIMDFPGRRIIGTQFNPNYFGFFIAIICVSAFILAKHYEKKSYWVVLLYFLIILSLSKSRTAMLATFVSFFAYYNFSLIYRKKYIKLVLIYSIFIGSFFTILSIADKPPFGHMTFFQRFKKSEYSLDEPNSLSSRVWEWNNLMDWFKQSPEVWLFGIGPQKNKEGKTVDSEYFDLLRQSGILGFIFIVFFELYILFRSIKIYFQSKNKDIRGLSLFLALMIVMLLIFNITAKMMADIQNISLIIIVMGIFFNRIYKATMSEANIEFQRVN